MYIQVLPLKGLTKPLWYHSNNFQVTIGNVVLVPLQAQVIPAIIVQIKEQIELPYEIKEIISVEKFPDDIQYLNFIKQVAYYYQIKPLLLIKRFRKFIEQKNEASQELGPAIIDAKLTQLTTEQQKAYEQILPEIIDPKYKVTILHGVTGSGKTEVYRCLTETTLNLNKTVLLLLPEVSLAMQFEAIMRKKLPNNLVLGFHSATNAKQKKQLWQAVINNQSCLIIGVHLPILLPIGNLGLIIVDEEHETGYQEKKHPKINSKELSIMRAHAYKIPIVLGSATPSISSLYNLNRAEWQKADLTKRFNGAFPKIKLVQIGKDKKQPHFLITKDLASSIAKKLDQKEQIIIFLNRRGYSFFVQCFACKFIFNCSHCNVSLTLHKDNSLRCHYCDFKKILPDSCPECLSKKFIKKGIGTQQVVTILEKLFPNAKIDRADLDTTSKKKEWQKTVEKFTNGEIDILVGTQTITKGYHFPGVTLVGILWADINLHLPIFNAAENSLQQILQVAGRAGRQSQDSEVIVQTMSPHYIFNYLKEEAYLDFYENEIQKRAITNYPPHIRLIEIELRHQGEKLVEREIDHFYNELEKKSCEISNTIEILGPVKPVLSKLKNLHTRKIYLKSIDITSAIGLFKLIDQSVYKSQIFFTPNPLY